MIEKNPRVCNVMSIDVLNEKIAKQQEKLNQLKAQKEEEIKAIHNIILGSNISDLT